MLASSARKIEAFISYSHKDDEWRAKLESHLSLLKREGVINLWHDRRIDAGREWPDEIDANRKGPRSFCSWISSDFIASYYCYEGEMKRALERHDAGDACVVPVIVRSVVLARRAVRLKLQALPKGRQGGESPGRTRTRRSPTSLRHRKVVEELDDHHRLGLTDGWRTNIEASVCRPSGTCRFCPQPTSTGGTSCSMSWTRSSTDGRLALTAVRDIGGVGRPSSRSNTPTLTSRLRPRLVAARRGADLSARRLRCTGRAARHPGGWARASSPRSRKRYSPTLTRRDRWLLVFDNAARPDLPDEPVAESRRGRC